MSREVQLKVRPVPRPDSERGSTGIGILSRLVLGLTVLVSILAALSALYGFGGDVLDPILVVLPIVLGSAGVLLGLIAVGLGLKAQSSRPYMEAATTAIFLGIAALLFSIGSTLATGRIEKFREIAAKADEVKAQADKAEAARREAELLKADAQRARFEALEEPLKIKKATNDTLDQIRREEVSLKQERAEAKKEIGVEHDKIEIKRGEVAR